MLMQYQIQMLQQQLQQLTLGQQMPARTNAQPAQTMQQPQQMQQMQQMQQPNQGKTAAGKTSRSMQPSFSGRR